MSDLIDRQQAIELLLKWADGYSYIETPTDAAVEAFRKLPSAEPDVLDTNVEDTISRKAAIEAFQKELCREREYAIGFSGIERILNALPSAQPEVVRCKECMYYDLFPNGANGTCEKHIDAMAVFYPWDFCSYAERRTDERP